jgi:hypothetical protein
VQYFYSATPETSINNNTLEEERPTVVHYNKSLQHLEENVVTNTHYRELNIWKAANSPRYK